MLKFLMVFFLSFSLYGIDAETIVQKVVNNLDGKTAEMTLTMEVTTKRYKRSVKMESFSEENDKSFIRILYPKKDKGITFLKRDHGMWQYVPKIERIIKIPASMMLQSWMGSDFSNDDLVRESSMERDYDKKLLSDKETYDIELLPKEEAAVVWGKLLMKVDKTHFLPTSISYYDEEGELVRILYYKEFKKFYGRLYPARWELIPMTEEKKGHKTVIIVEKARFDFPIEAKHFTKRALKCYSK